MNRFWRDHLDNLIQSLGEADKAAVDAIQTGNDILAEKMARTIAMAIYAMVLKDNETTRAAYDSASVDLMQELRSLTDMLDGKFAGGSLPN